MVNSDNSQPGPRNGREFPSSPSRPAGNAGDGFLPPGTPSAWQLGQIPSTPQGVGQIYSSQRGEMSSYIGNSQRMTTGTPASSQMAGPYASQSPFTPHPFTDPATPGGPQSTGLGGFGSPPFLHPHTPGGGMSATNPSELHSHLDTPAAPGEDPSATVRVIWGTTVDIQESMALFHNFLLEYKLKYQLSPEESHRALEPNFQDPYYPRILQQMRDAESYNLNLNCHNLLAYPRCVKLYHQLVQYPQEIIPLMDHVLTQTFYELFSDLEYTGGQELTVRPYNLERSINMRDLNPGDMDKLVSIKGLMIRSSAVIPDMKQAFFRCSNCDFAMLVSIDRGRIAEPTKCPRDICNSNGTMQLIHNRSQFADKQVCRLQETPDVIPDGQTPHTVALCMYDELVDVAKPGDRLEITGIFRGVPVRPNPRHRSMKSLFRTYIDVVHVRKSSQQRLQLDRQITGENEFVVDFQEEEQEQGFTPEQEQEIQRASKRSNLYAQLAQSLAPSIFQMEDVKKAILLQLFGGTTKTFQEKAIPKSRGDINLLLVGDPGISKSQMLKYAHKIAPRGVYTSGKGSSAVGLTAYVTRDPDTRQVVLESGALVLSDGGICCIDEFDKMSETTRSILHEVMEQQTVSIAKAGIIATLNARTSILASANPRESKWQRHLSVTENANIPPPLLSRFDVVFVLIDKVDDFEDRRLAKHLVSLYTEDAPSVAPTGAGGDGDDGPQAILSIEQLTRYISYARRYIHPVLTENACAVLTNQYVELRKLGYSRNARVFSSTTRQLESMIRLAEAHARMRFSTVVEAEDADEAARLVRTGIQLAATDPLTGAIDLDLIATGISSHARRFLDDMKKELLTLLTNRSVPATRWHVALEELNEQSSVEVPSRDFEQVVRELETEGHVQITGERGHRLIRRLAGGPMMF
ncbi:MCM DNA helicase complex subunit [Tieghemiomyces parasiticus]|uniref:DNA replication licensing factor MCM4 n=1 Tax=Tieghemiomyces parasiticus TaxID=78921 RepID=A0A9W8DZX0_9FUNG|nr:MCM DNA helicase complex subunit [Tieghemiomyces parasiticus]